MSAVIFLILRIILAVALYAFLGWALWSLWRILRQHSQVGAAARPPALSLTLQDEVPPRVHRFTRPEIIIGRDPACDSPVADKTVSARHARLSFHHGQWWVEDLDSRNGTLLNQEPVHEPLVVTSGDLLTCGQMALDIQIVEAGPAQNRV